MAAADALLRAAVPDQLRDRGRDRSRAGVPVRDELVGLLEVRRQRVRRAARDRGARRLHARGDVPRASGSSAGTGSRRACTWRRSGWPCSVRWLSAYFILVANSCMQHPVGYKIVNGEAQLTSVWAAAVERVALWAFGHTMLAGLTFGVAVVFGVCCWHFAARAECRAVPDRGQALADRARAGRVRQPLVRQQLRRSCHRASADEDRGLRGALGHRASRRRSRSSRSAASRRATRRRASLSTIPGLLSFLATGSFNGKVVGPEPAQQAVRAAYGPGNYIPPSKRSTGHARDGVPRSRCGARGAARGVSVLARRRLERRAGSSGPRVVTIAFPFFAAPSAGC